MIRVVYLHGFASSVQSSKARAFAERFAALGIRVDIPDLNTPSFETLTITRMIEQTAGLIPEGSGPVVLIGSSLGAFVAVHAAARRPADVERLVLLAPALDFAQSRMRELSAAEIARWRESGRLDVFHFGFGRVMPLGYAMYEDAAKHDAFALRLPQSVLIFQGTRDTVVDPAVATRFASTRPNVTVRLLDDDHQLLASLPAIWRETRAFLGLRAEGE